MGALFVATGPAFRRGAKLSPFENIHIYNVLCAALHIQPARNDGNPRVAQHMLAPPRARWRPRQIFTKRSESTPRPRAGCVTLTAWR
jgi:hypothetical protein